MKKLTTFAACAGMLGGALRIAAAFLPYTPESAWLETLYAACDLGMLFGLIGVYISVEKIVGVIGLTFFVIALSALASIVGPDSQMFGVDFYRLGAAVFALALAAFSIALLRAPSFRAAAMLWIICAMLGIVSTVTGNATAFFAAGVALGAGFLIAGAMTFRTQPS